MRWRIAVVVLAMASAVVWACSHNYIPYLDGYYARTLLPTLFSIECNVILGNKPVADRSEVDWPKREPKTLPYEESHDPQENSRRAEAADLREAVATRADADAIVAAYDRVRAAIETHFRDWHYQIERARSNPYRRMDEVPSPAPMDLGPHESDLGLLPAEFALYLRGAAAYHGGQWDAAIDYFNNVLDLPKHERSYKSTWAAFMLGKAWTNKDPSQAGQHFEQTQQLAADGFRDTLGLAADCPGWQARAEMEAGDYAAAIHRYASLSPEPSVNIGRVCERALRQEVVDARLVSDPVCRQLVTVWLTSHPRSVELAEKWLTTLDTLQPGEFTEGADHLAMLCYSRGDMEAARRWLAHCPADMPYAAWVRAKLLLYDGKFEEAAAQLKRTAEILPVDPRWRIDIPDDHELTVYGAVYAADFVQADLGFASLRAGDNSKALSAFIAAQDTPDAVTVAEEIMSTEELRAFCDVYGDIEQDAAERRGLAFGSYTVMTGDDVRSILARRYARAGQWAEAAPYYPEKVGRGYGGRLTTPNLHDTAMQMEQWLSDGSNEQLEKRVRAEAWFNFAKTIREWGFHLFNPVGMPSGNDPAYPRMNYFKWFAADHMWKAAELLPDNDVLCANALYTGGTYIKNKDPEGAGKFYKALVRRNPNLRIAIEADAKRWFPEEFTDEVVYRPFPKPWYGRRSNLAVAGFALLAAVASVAAALIVRWRLEKAPPSRMVTY